MDSPFPLPSFIARFGTLPRRDVPYVVVGMFTASHAGGANRLAESLELFNLPHLLFEVPSVHRSTSPKGTLDPSYTKPSFIHFCLRLLGCPVLYVDCDVVFRKPPTLLDSIAKEKADFAILNWLALDRNDAYRPLPIEKDPSSVGNQNRFFTTSHQIPYTSTNQLICSGAVQFWGYSKSAQALLSAWNQCVLKNPNSRDDHSLDFAFNNLNQDQTPILRTVWLPKPYARYAWWIFDDPIIDHPQFPYAGGHWTSLEESEGKSRIRQEQMTMRDTIWTFPENTIFDSQSKLYFQILNSNLVPLGRLDEPFYLIGDAQGVDHHSG